MRKKLCLLLALCIYKTYNNRCFPLQLLQYHSLLLWSLHCIDTRSKSKGCPSAPTNIGVYQFGPPPPTPVQSVTLDTRPITLTSKYKSGIVKVPVHFNVY